MSDSSAKVTKNTNKVFPALIVVGFLVGIGLLVLAKYMLTNYSYSLAQTHRSNAVNVSGKIVLLLSLILLVFYALMLLMKKNSQTKTSNK
jgi:hypothetical protein